MDHSRRKILIGSGVAGSAFLGTGLAYTSLPSDESEESNESEDNETGEESNESEEPADMAEIETDRELYVDFSEEDYLDRFTETNYTENLDLTEYYAWENKSLQVSIPEESHYGTSLRYTFPAESSIHPKELWASYYVFFPRHFRLSGQEGKLPGPAGTYDRGGWGGRESEGSNGWSARMGFRDFETDGIGIGYYVYHADMEHWYGDFFRWDESLSKGTWHRIDQYVHVNTPGYHNGVLMGWVDGNQAFDRRNIRFRDVFDIRIEEYWVNVYWGGSDPSPRDNWLVLDDLTLRTRADGESEQ